MDAGPELKMLRRGFGELGLEFTARHEEGFKKYLEMLYRYHGRVHLISHGDYNRIALRHFLPSLLGIRYLTGKSSVADIGAGAGFPSIPLMIAVPGPKCTVYESSGKKARFLTELIRDLGLADVEVVNDRAENHLHRTCDLVLARAAGTVSQLVKNAGPMIGQAGMMIMYKSAEIESELNRAAALIAGSGLACTVDRVLTPVEHVPVSLVCIRRAAA